MRKAVFDRVLREVKVVLLAREALFLRRGSNLTVDDQRRRAVMIIR